AQLVPVPDPDGRPLLDRLPSVARRRKLEPALGERLPALRIVMKLDDRRRDPLRVVAHDDVLTVDESAALDADRGRDAGDAVTETRRDFPLEPGAISKRRNGGANLPVEIGRASSREATDAIETDG